MGPTETVIVTDDDGPGTGGATSSTDGGAAARTAAKRKGGGKGRGARSRSPSARRRVITHVSGARHGVLCEHARPADWEDDRAGEDLREPVDNSPGTLAMFEEASQLCHQCKWHQLAEYVRIQPEVCRTRQPTGMTGAGYSLLATILCKSSPDWLVRFIFVRTSTDLLGCRGRKRDR